MLVKMRGSWVASGRNRILRVMFTFCKSARRPQTVRNTHTHTNEQADEWLLYHRDVKVYCGTYLYCQWWQGRYVDGICSQRWLASGPRGSGSVSPPQLLNPAPPETGQRSQPCALHPLKHMNRKMVLNMDALPTQSNKHSECYSS